MGWEKVERKGVRWEKEEREGIGSEKGEREREQYAKPVNTNKSTFELLGI